MAIDAVLFDLDGTLVDTLGDIGAAMNHALVSHGIAPHPIEAYRDFIGGGVFEMIAQVAAANPSRHAEVLGSFRERYDRDLIVGSAPYPGVIALLDALAARRMPIAVVSNKPQPWTERMVHALFPGRFASIHGHAPPRPAKPHPEMALAAAAELGATPARCLYVGDTEVDRETARAAGMIAVGVRWGFRPGELAGCAHIVGHPSELLEIVQVLGSAGEMTER